MISGEKENVYVCESEKVFKLGRYSDERERERERERESERGIVC